MFKKNLSKKTVILILIGIIAIQTIIYFLVGMQKSYIHIDEGYSYGLINYDKLDITANEDFYNTWHTKDYYNDYLTVNSDEKDNWMPVYENQKNDVHPPFYYLLLRIADMFSIDHFSVWPGIILNIIIHIGITIFIYLIANKLFGNKIYALIVAFAGGLTVSALETVILARMYALTALNIAIITYLHIINFEKENIDIKSLSIMGACIVIGSLTHYYYLVYLFVLYVIFMIKYITSKNYKMAIKYTVCMAISGVISLIIFPYSFVHIFMGYRGQGMLSNLTDIKAMWSGIGEYIGITIMDVFNGLLIFILLAIIGIFIYEIVRKKEITFKFKNKYLPIILIPTLIYFAIIALGAPYKEIRYIMPICPLIFILFIYAFKVVLERVFKDKTIFIIITSLLCIMLITPIITSWNITYLYPDLKGIVYKIKNTHDMPTIFIFNKDMNRFMDDIYLFSLIDESYIMDSKLISEENIKEILKDKNLEKGLRIFINEGNNNDECIEMILNVTGLEEWNYVKRMNACDIYYLH